ncbi:hypothetical protein Tco_0055759, partial [Tanacetum coccineum]
MHICERFKYIVKLLCKRAPGNGKKTARAAKEKIKDTDVENADITEFEEEKFCEDDMFEEYGREHVPTDVE